MRLSNTLLFSQMNAATRAMFQKGPAAATRSVMQSAMKNATAVQQAIGPVRESLSFGAACNQPSYEQARVAEDIVPEMFAQLGRIKDAPATLFAARGAECPAAAEPLPGTFIDDSHTNAAGTRTYKLYVPSTYTGEPRPLVVMLHGCTQDPDDFALGTQMNVLAEEGGFLVVYPAQSGQANKARCWKWYNAIDQQRDQGEPSIIAGITRDVMARYAVEPAQVYVAGLSAGGAMAAIMGHLYPELFAAVGVHSGMPFATADNLPSAIIAMKSGMQRRHKPDQAIPMIVFHGDRDTTVHPRNGRTLIEQVRHTTEEVAVESGKAPGGHGFTRTLHQDAGGRVHAEHWLVHGEGHAWSGGHPSGTFTDGKGPDASREMLRFFKTQR
jgi:poly(hydroxyalkanoate) depolymerase family esterase